jgi:hypothetical protein
MVKFRSDGNGGTHINVKPGILTLISLCVMLATTIFGMGVRWTKQEDKIVILESGKIENRRLIDATTRTVDSLHVCMARIEGKQETIQSDIRWIKEHLAEK